MFRGPFFPVTVYILSTFQIIRYTDRYTDIIN